LGRNPTDARTGGAANYTSVINGRNDALTDASLDHFRQGESDDQIIAIDKPSLI